MFEGKPIPDSPASVHVKSARLKKLRTMTNPEEGPSGGDGHAPKPAPFATRVKLADGPPDVVIDVAEEDVPPQSSAGPAGLYPITEEQPTSGGPAPKSDSANANPHRKRKAQG
mmetsp:Transcript_10094/g.36879  ORF Transcript_10094/g.36879 Transcript_10094/m.36879 type:complete len:113 (+) Transcript_10094:234-572(+)